MADSASDKPQRSAADKERSRQQSRQVSGKEAARTPGRSSRPQTRPGGGQRGQAPKGGRGQQQAGPKRGGQSARPGAGTKSRRPRRPAARRSRTGLYTWGAIALVIVVVIVVVVVSQAGKTTKTTNLVYKSQPVPASIVDEVTHVPTSVFDKVGTGLSSDIKPPAVVSGQPALKFTGKPGVLGIFGEFCPFCAAERWSIITSLSRFGTFSGLKTMQSSPVDYAPKTQTFTFATATYTSPYFAAKLVEVYGQDTKSTGFHPVIKKPTKQEQSVITKYDSGSSTSSGGTIPFFDIGNKAIFSGASFTPKLLAGLSRATIAADLSHPSNPVTQLIIGASNNISAGICAIDGGKPGAVCSSSGVQAAAKALKLHA